jgi:hypothetical protein
MLVGVVNLSATGEEMYVVTEEEFEKHFAIKGRIK